MKDSYIYRIIGAFTFVMFGNPLIEMNVDSFGDIIVWLWLLICALAGLVLLIFGVNPFPSYYGNISDSNENDD